MMIPAEEFHELISKLGLATRFKIMLTERLWLGLCGRCGAFGDHTPIDCPQFGRHEEQTMSTRRILKRFLSHYDLLHMEEKLKTIGITDFETLMESDSEALMSRLSDDDYESLFNARNCYHSRHTSMYEPDDHIVFLSHYKYEAGTEAALMQKELGQLIHEMRGGDFHQHHVFLDSEDLQDLQDLQMHVRRSQNLVLLLTPGVLKRPWVLVEISTATRAGVHIVPVEIQRKGRQFTYPDALFFERLRNGTILQSEARNLLESLDIKLSELSWSVQQIFSQIAMPYSPHRPETIRQAELKDILKRCKVPESVHSPSKQRSSMTSLSSSARRSS